MKTALFSVLPCLLLGACSAQAPKPADPAARARVEALQQRGVAAPLAILPVHVLGRPNGDVADALGLVLEKQGLSDLRVLAAPFAAPTDWAAVPAALGEHVRAAKDTVGDRHVLYAQFLGDPRQGPTEVRFALVDARGEPVLVDRQTPADPDFQRTAGRDPDPLGCASLVSERLLAGVGWRAVAGGVPNGPFAERWRLKSGAPDAQERAAMAARVAELRAALASRTFVVLPTVGAAADDTGAAARLAEACAKELGCHTKTAAGSLVVSASPNQQRRLWSLAAAAHAWLGDHPLDADHLLVADIGIDAGGTKGYVNFVLLDRQRRVVLAEFDNDQSPLFARVQPKNAIDAEAIVLARLRERLR